MSEPNLAPEIAQLITGSSSADLQQLFGQLKSATPFGASTPVPSRRRPQRADVVTYRIRVDLNEAKPPIWRRLELASDLTLDQLHDIVQTAMGWTDSHLHEFAKGDNPTDRRAEHYRPQESLDNELPGVDEVSVRLDEVLVEPGDRLFYNYDFGMTGPVPCVWSLSHLANRSSLRRPVWPAHVPAHRRTAAESGHITICSER